MRTIRCAAIAILFGAAAFAQTGGFDSLSKRADAARQQNREEEARAFYKQALKLKPDWREGWWYLGTLQYDANHYPEAIAALQKLVLLAPQIGPAWAFLGLSEFESKDYENALAHLEKTYFFASKPSGIVISSRARSLSPWTTIASRTLKDRQRSSSVVGTVGKTKNMNFISRTS